MRALERLVLELRDELKVPGVAAGLLLDGAEQTACAGVTSTENPLPVDPDTLFRVASITKTFTATAVARLVEAGKLELDRPVREYLPDLTLADEECAHGLTACHLLTHMAGFQGDLFGDTGDGDDALAKMVVELAQLPQLTPLGTVWSYNNAGFILAGRLVEVLASRPYEEAIRELVLEPLAMKGSTFAADDAITHRVALGHTLRRSQPRVMRPWRLPRGINPAGGLVSSVRELLRYLRFHLGDELASMRQPLAEVGETGEQVGLAWRLRSWGGVTFAGHNGSLPGLTSFMELAPQRNYALVVLTNSTDGPQLYNQIASWAHGDLLSLPDATPELLRRGPDELREYAGGYTATLSRTLLRLSDDGRLVVRTIPTPTGVLALVEPKGTPPPPATLGFVEPDRAVILDGPMKGGPAEFLRDPKGRIEWLRIGGRIARRSGEGVRAEGAAGSALTRPWGRSGARR